MNIVFMILAILCLGSALYGFYTDKPDSLLMMAIGLLFGIWAELKNMQLENPDTKAGA